LGIGGDRVGCGAEEADLSVTKLPSGRWRAQVYDPATGTNVSVSTLLGGPGTFATKTEAKRARERARERLGDSREASVTLAAFWERWTTDSLFARPKESTNIHNRERTKNFVASYGARPIDEIDDAVVAEWLAGGKRSGTVPALRARCSTMPPRRRPAGLCAATRLRDSGPHAVPVVGTSSWARRFALPPARGSQAP
jgi:hypothetical protein